jgi:hypothetical protein
VRRSTVVLALVLLVLLGAMAAKSLLVEIPPVRAHAEAGQFDANRAAARLAFVLGDQRPHPTDTDADDAVRSRIVALLQGMGLKPVVRDQLTCNELYKARGVSCARVHNVIAAIGPASGKAVLLNAHYDSVSVGPGAADDGAGVATMLEVAQQLKDKPLRRPVMLLFNEGEELGLVGARAFLADPLSRDVDSVVNLEARGVRGPVNMFETSRPNGPAISIFQRAVEDPFANSLSTDIYRLLPNYTDVNSFSERGWLTLNLAPIGNETRYHSPGDDLAALDRATLQHMGDQTLALADELANGAPEGSGDQIFMDIGGRTLVVLPLVLGVVVLIGLLIGFGFLSWRRGGTALGIGTAVAAMIASTVLAWLMISVIGVIRPGMFWRAHPIWTHVATYASAILVALIALRLLARRLTVGQLRAAYWLFYLIIGALVAIVAPGGIIYFLFPPLVMLAGVGIQRFSPAAERTAAMLALLVLYFTLGTMLVQLQALLNGGPMWVFAPLGTLIIFPALIEAMDSIDDVRTQEAAAMAGGLALVAWLAALASPAYSADRQQRFVVQHVTDAATGKAYWSAINDGAALPRRFSVEGKWRWASLPYSDRRRWVTDAPPIAGIQPPVAQLLSQVQNGGQRTVTLRLKANGADRISLIAPENARIRAAGVPGFIRPIDARENGKYDVDCFGRSCDGLTLIAVIDQAKPVELTVVGSRPELPPGAAPLLAARPKFARPQYNRDESIVFTRVKV